MDSTVREHSISDILDKVQDTSAAHLKYCVLLKRRLDNDETEEVLEELLKCIRIALKASYTEKNLYHERLLAFFASLVSSFKVESEEELDHPIVEKVVGMLLECSQNVNENVRFWSCKLITKIIEQMEELGDDLYENFKDTLLDRLRDSKAAIRMEAIISLHRIQDTADKKDPITLELIHLIENDSNAKVRRLCVEKVVIRKDTIPMILNRARDVDENVRLAAFKHISKISEYLKIVQRRYVLKLGILDTSELIRKYVSTVLVESWYETYKRNYLKLIESIRLGASDEDIAEGIEYIEFMLSALFTSKSFREIVEVLNLNQNKTLKMENLNWDLAIYYRVALQYLRKAGNIEDIASDALPELFDFCQFIRDYNKCVAENDEYDYLEYQFILSQLFLITKTYDITDTYGRNALLTLLKHMLQNVDLNEVVAGLIVQNLTRFFPNIEALSLYVCEIISNIMYGETHTEEVQMEEENNKIQQISEIKTELALLYSQQSTALTEKQFAEADRLEKEIKLKNELLETCEKTPEPAVLEKKTDDGTILRYLGVAEALLKLPAIKALSVPLITLRNDVITKVMMHENDDIKLKALSCYVLCCIVDEETAKYGIHIISAPLIAYHQGEDCETTHLLLSIKAIGDILRVYGTRLVAEPSEEEDEDFSSSRQEDEQKIFVGGTSLTDILQSLADILEDEQPQLQEVAGLTICLLLMNRTIQSATLVSRLIIKWANPASDSNTDCLKAFIGLTLNKLPIHPDFIEYFDDVVINTISALVSAPATSPLSDININNIAKFMLELSRSNTQSLEIEKNLAIKICTKMIKKPKSKVNHMLSKLLLLLILPEDACLVQLCDELLDAISDKATLKNIKKFITTVSK